MDPVKLPPGYLLPDDMTMKDVLCIDAALLASEGIDPKWPGFDEKPDDVELAKLCLEVVIASKRCKQGALRDSVGPARKLQIGDRLGVDPSPDGPLVDARASELA